MSQYMITYLGGDHPSSPEEGQKHFARYKQWLASLGEAAISPANPLKGTTTVSPDGSVSVGGIDLFHEIYRPLLFNSYKAPSAYCYRCPLGRFEW